MTKYIILSIAFSVLTSCGSKQTQTKTAAETPSETTVELTEAQLKNSEIQTGKIQQHNISSLLKVNGKIEVPPQNMVSVRWVAKALDKFSIAPPP